MSTVRLLPNQPCQEEMEHHCAQALRKFRMLGAESPPTPTHPHPAHMCLVALSASSAGLEEVGCARGPLADRYTQPGQGPSEEGSLRPPTSFLSGLFRSKRWAWVSRD